MSSSPKKPLTILQHRQDFLAIAAHGKKWAAPGLILQVKATPKEAAENALRFGLTASGKIGSAVIRNRAKRRLRALVNELFPQHAAQGYDYVLIARTTTTKRSYDELRADLTAALKKLGAWREP